MPGAGKENGAHNLTCIIEDTGEVKILNFSSRTLSTNGAFLVIMDVNSSSVCLENGVKDTKSTKRLANLFAFHKASLFGIANA